MSNIYIYSPSGAVRDKAGFLRGVAHLKGMGHSVEIDPDALNSHLRFAGDDATRLSAISRAAASGADITMMSRGGYGLTRLLPKLPYKAILKSMGQGTQWMGHSDFTSMQMAVLSQIDAMTWAGPHLIFDFGPPKVDDIMQACFEDVTLGQSEGLGWRVPAQNLKTLKIKPSGVVAKNATLWGGNLAVFASLVGTPYLPKVENGVLFFEDVGEHPYKIERLLTQLLNAGILVKQKAIVLGSFTDYTLIDHDKGFDLYNVVQFLQSHLKIPVVTGFPMGHVSTKVCLPVGAKVNFHIDGNEAFLMWGAIGH